MSAQESKALAHRVVEEAINFVEHWTVVDQLSMMQQLGVIPSPEQAPA